MFSREEGASSTSISLKWPGNTASITLAQVAKCITNFKLMVLCSEVKGIGFLGYQLNMSALKNIIWEVWSEMAWNAIEETGSLLPTSNPPFRLGNNIGINVLTWNCRGVLNPCFRRALHDLLQINNPAILILTETRLGGERAAALARSFPFDGFLCTKTIEFAGGIWMLRNSAAVEVEHLCSTEQEIHVSVKVYNSKYVWLLLAIYASPRRAEHRLLWENLFVIAGLHNLPWVMVGDFNDIIVCEEKWGGNIPNFGRIAEYRPCINSCNMIDLGF